jgi:hypothetical protein
VFGICRILGCRDAWIKHGHVYSIIPFSSNPTRMDSSSNRVGVVAVYTCTPQMSF